jgi:hypothetical protein
MLSVTTLKFIALVMTAWPESMSCLRRLYLGIDMHLKQRQIAILTSRGE